MYCQLFQRNEPPAPGRVQGEEGAEKSPVSAEHAVNGGAEGADPSQGGAEKSARVPEVDATPAAAMEGGEELVGLVQLAQSSVDGFFELLNAKVAHSLSRDMPPGASTSSSSGGTPETSERRSEMTSNTGEADDLDAVALGGVVAAVQQLVSDMETVDPHVPQVLSRAPFAARFVLGLGWPRQASEGRHCSRLKGFGHVSKDAFLPS